MKPTVRVNARNSLPLAAAIASLLAPNVHADSFTSTSATGGWNSARWNNSADAPPYNAVFTANNAVQFTSGTYSFDKGINSGTINIGNVTLSDDVTVNFTGTVSGTYGTGGQVRTINVGTGSTFNMGTQAVATAAGTGFIKSGEGTWITAGSLYTGGFTLNEGTIALAGVNGMGGGAGNTLTINGGTIRSIGTTGRNLGGKYGGGITIGGDFTIGDSENTGGLTFTNAMSLGAATRTITMIANANFNGAITGDGGIIKAGPGSLNFGGDVTNSYAGSTTVSGGNLSANYPGTLPGFNTAGRVIFEGGTISVRVADDRWTTAQVDDLLANATKTSGALGLDTTNGNLTQWTAFSTTNFGSNLGLAKLGAGILTLDQANNYNGVTTMRSNTSSSILVTANGALGATGSGKETYIEINTAGTGPQIGFSGGIIYSDAEKIIGGGSGNGAASGVFAAVQRGFIQSVSGHNTFAGDIELSVNGISRIGTQDGAQLTLTGAITQAAGISSANIMFRAGNLDGDFVTLSNTGNSFGGDSLIFTSLNTAGQYAGVRLGASNAMPTDLTISGVTSTGASSTALDLNGKDQELNGLITGQARINIINLDTGNASTLTLNPTEDKSTNNTLILGGSPGDTPLGTIHIVKTGSFAQSLGGAHTHTGSTLVSAGTLYLTGSIGSSAVTVEAGATIGSNGANGLLGNGLTIEEGGILDLTGAVLGSDSSGVLSITGGSLALGNLSFANLHGWDWMNAEPGTYELIDGSFAVDFGSTAYLSEATAFDFGNGKMGYFTSGSLNAVIIPEPSCALLGGLGLLVLLRCRRR